MTCCTAFVYESSRSPPSWATCGRPAGQWGSIPRPTIAGSGSWTAMAPRSCGPGNDACRGWPPDQRAGRAAGRRLRPGPPGLWAGPDRGRAAPTQVGRHPAVDQRGVAGAGRHGLSTRAKRYGLVAGYAAPPEPQRSEPAPERHLQVDHPGELGQLDCFCIGRLSGTKGTVWQYTAIDVASAYAWASLHV